MKKNKKYYQSYLDDIRGDLGILLRKKLFKHLNEIFQGLNILVSELEIIAVEITSKITALNGSERDYIEQDILTLLDKIKRSREALRALYDMQMEISPGNGFEIIEGME